MSDKWYKTRWNPMIGGMNRNIPAMGEDSRDGEYVRFDEASAEIDRLRSDLATANSHIEALQEKEASECACSYDRPDDVCLFHSRMKADAHNEALEEAADLLEMRAANYERISCDVWQTDTTKRLFAAMASRFLNAAAVIRALKKGAN